tara:strand:- start:161788 stop:161940 length:153 start_codon:yes stop_codon:yes gene_type:complete
MKRNILRGTAKLLFAVLFAGGILAMTACNTVRGIGKDISSAADTLDPNSK